MAFPIGVSDFAAEDDNKAATTAAADNTGKIGGGEKHARVALFVELIVIVSFDVVTFVDPAQALAR